MSETAQLMLRANDSVIAVNTFQNGSVELVDVELVPGCTFADLAGDVPPSIKLYGECEPPNGDVVLIDESQSNTGVEIA